jgi:hypothetical protein
VPTDDDRDDADPTVCSDTDGDLCDDCSSGTFAPDADGTDVDADGLCSARDPDDADADADEDGVRDGDERSPFVDTDGDGLPNVVDADSDDDGLLDGTELGSDCVDPATDPAICVPDANPETITDPLSRDTDGGGVTDTNEDPNLDGAVDDGEGDPLTGADDAGQTVADGDGDGLSDAAEAALGTDPDDADSDDDGTLAVRSATPVSTPTAMACAMAGTRTATTTACSTGSRRARTALPSARRCHPVRSTRIPTEHQPVARGHDACGIRDGAEDANQNGAVDAGETDLPTRSMTDRAMATRTAALLTTVSCVIPTPASASWAVAARAAPRLPGGRDLHLDRRLARPLRGCGSGGAGGAGGASAAGAAGGPPRGRRGQTATGGAAGERRRRGRRRNRDGRRRGGRPTGGAAGRAATGGAAGEPAIAGAAGEPQTGGRRRSPGAPAREAPWRRRRDPGPELEGGGCDCARRAGRRAWSGHGSRSRRWSSGGDDGAGELEVPTRATAEGAEALPRTRGRAST